MSILYLSDQGKLTATSAATRISNKHKGLWTWNRVKVCTKLGKCTPKQLTNCASWPTIEQLGSISWPAVIAWLLGISCLMMWVRLKGFEGTGNISASHVFLCSERLIVVHKNWDVDARALCQHPIFPLKVCITCVCSWLFKTKPFVRQKGPSKRLFGSSISLKWLWTTDWFWTIGFQQIIKSSQWTCGLPLETGGVRNDVASCRFRWERNLSCALWNLWCMGTLAGTTRVTSVLGIEYSSIDVWLAQSWPYQPYWTICCRIYYSMQGKRRFVLEPGAPLKKRKSLKQVSWCRKGIHQQSILSFKRRWCLGKAKHRGLCYWGLAQNRVPNKPMARGQMVLGLRSLSVAMGLKTQTRHWLTVRSKLRKIIFAGLQALKPKPFGHQVWDVGHWRYDSLSKTQKALSSGKTSHRKSNQPNPTNPQVFSPSVSSALKSPSLNEGSASFAPSKQSSLRSSAILPLPPPLKGGGRGKMAELRLKKIRKQR